MHTRAAGENRFRAMHLGGITAAVAAAGAEAAGDAADVHQ